MSEFQDRQKRFDALNAVIKLHGKKPLSREQRAQVNDWKDRLEFRLTELKKETIVKEQDIKLEILEKVADIYRNA